MVVDELLVHISTPATRQNDQLYRSLADAYLNYEPYQNQAEDSQQHNVSSQSADTSLVSDPAVPNNGSSFHKNIDTSILSTSKDSYGSFPSHLSFDGHAARGYTGASYDDADVVEDEGFAPTSSRLARLERIHRNWKAQVTPKSSAVGKEGDGGDWSSFVEDEDEDVDTAFIEDTQDAVRALQSQLTDGFEGVYGDTEEETEDEEEEDIELAERTISNTAEMLQSEPPHSLWMAREDTFEDDSDAGNSTQEAPLLSAKPAGPQTATVAKESVPPRATPSLKVPAAAGNHRKSARLEEARCTAKTKTPLSSNQHPEPSSAVQEHQESLRSNDASKPAASIPQHNASENKSVHKTGKLDQFVDLTKLPLSVLAPEPKISITRPGTLPSQVTTYLAAIKAQNPNRFKPTRKLRSPAPDERGWWSIDCSLWPGQIQKDFWDAVCELLTEGRLGWATSLHREVDSQTLGEVRLYCWGELLEHMWLVLWLCSKGKICGAGLRWFDAWKNAVLEME